MTDYPTGTLVQDWVTCNAQVSLSNRKRFMGSPAARCPVMIPLPEKGGIIECPVCHQVR